MIIEVFLHVHTVVMLISTNTCRVWQLGISRNNKYQCLGSSPPGPQLIQLGKRLRKQPVYILSCLSAMQSTSETDFSSWGKEEKHLPARSLPASITVIAVSNLVHFQKHYIQHRKPDFNTGAKSLQSIIWHTKLFTSTAATWYRHVAIAPAPAELLAILFLSIQRCFQPRLMHIR